MDRKKYEEDRARRGDLKQYGGDTDRSVALGATIDLVWEGGE